MLLTLFVSEAYAAKFGTVTGYRVRFRAGPSTQTAILTEFYKGDEVEVIDYYKSKNEKYPWYKGIANLGNGPVEGWIYGQFLSIRR